MIRLISNGKTFLTEVQSPFIYFLLEYGLRIVFLFMVVIWGIKFFEYATNIRKTTLGGLSHKILNNQ